MSSEMILMRAFTHFESPTQRAKTAPANFPMRPSTSADSYTPGSLHRIEIESAIPTKCVLPTSLHPLALLCAAELSAGREGKKERKERRQKLFSAPLGTQSLLTTQYIVCRINGTEELLVCELYRGECVQRSALFPATRHFCNFLRLVLYCRRCQ
jgi:hypothetical protein